MAYSLDFRKRVFAVKEKRNLSFSQTADLFGVNIRTLFRWQNRIEPKTTRNKPGTKVGAEALEKDVAEHPDAYLQERADRLNVAKSTVWHALQRLGISRKKRVSAT